MNDLTKVTSDTLPSLIDRAAGALTSARTSAEVLEARDLARVAYDAAKSAGRMAKAKAAHDEVISAVYRAQADAAVIEARAKVRLADEYDAAQARGDVAGVGNPSIVGGDYNRPTTADLGLRRDEIRDARQLRDAEAASPGKIEAAAESLVGRGVEPTKAALRREVVGAAEKPTHGQDDDKITAKLRAEYRAMTPEAQEDDWIGLRLEIADLRKRVQKQRGQIADQNATIKSLSDGSDLGAKLSAKIRELQAVKLTRDDAMQSAKRMEYRLKKAEARVKELEAMGVPL